MPTHNFLVLLAFVCIAPHAGPRTCLVIGAVFAVLSLALRCAA